MTKFIKNKNLSNIVTMHEKLAIESKDIVAMNSNGACLYKLGKFDEAPSLFETILSIEPRNSMAGGNKGWVLYELKRYSEA